MILESGKIKNCVSFKAEGSVGRRALRDFCGDSFNSLQFNGLPTERTFTECFYVPLYVRTSYTKTKIKQPLPKREMIVLASDAREKLNS